MFNGAEASAALDHYRLLQSPCRAEIRRRGSPIPLPTVQQIALGQIGAVALELGIFGEKPSHPLHHFRPRLDHAQLPSGRPSAITGRRPLSA
jgi:hypothetical protein